MKRYIKEVKLLDEGKIDVKEFVRRIMNTSKINEYQAAAAYMIYREDGGRKYKPEDFDRAVEVREYEENTVEKLLKLVKEGVE